jgi:heat shock protein HtpX
MASVYSHKDSNIRKTWFLFTGFLIVVIGFGWVMSGAYGNPAILYFTVIVSTLVSVVSYWYSDKMVLAMTHARPVSMENAPELYRIVENLAITAGLPMPKVYIVPELAPNAFATGRDPTHAVVAVTEGLLKKLDRSELEGVVAHELSHIGNRDILVGTVAVVLVGFVAILSDVFVRTAFWGGGSRDRRGGNPVIMGIALVAAVLAPIAATLIRLAISRKREFLADASGALLTRYPEGLARALETISRDATPMRAAANATAHLWLDDPFKGEEKASWFHKLFMTHPPVRERLAALRGMSV